MMLLFCPLSLQANPVISQLAEEMASVGMGMVIGGILFGLTSVIEV